MLALAIVELEVVFLWIEFFIIGSIFKLQIFLTVPFD